MEHKYKSLELKLKSDESGKIAGYFSTYDEEPDSYGDIIKPGAFTETIQKRKESGHPFPLCFNHDFSKVIGVVDSVEDTEKGPYIEGHFLDTELANDVRKMLMSGAIYQFSFAYDVLGWEEPSKELRDKGVFNVLTKLEVFEISVVTVPANQNAVVTEVKSDVPEVKAGKRNSKSDEETIKTIISLAESLLTKADDNQDEKVEEEAKGEVNEASEEPKSEGNSKATDMILEKIKAIKEAEHDS